MHSNANSKTLKTKYEEVLLGRDSLLRPDSLGLKFSTPSSTICHVNDNPLYGTKFESETTNCTSNNTNESHLHNLNPPTSPSFAHNSFDKPLKNTSNEALQTNSKETCSTLFLKNSPIYNSLEMTPLYESAITTPICKSPEPNKEVNKISSLQFESRFHKKEVEIVEEGIFLTPNNRRIKELDTKKLINKNDGRCEKENGSTLEVLHTINLIGGTKDILKKECCQEKVDFNYNSKVCSSKNISKCQFILWPMVIFFRVFTYPFKLFFKLFLFLLGIFKFFFGVIAKALKKFKNITIMDVGNIRSKILKNSQSGCNNAQGYSRCGCASKTYILVVLSSLVLPSLFDLDFYLVNRFIEGQVVIREALNFDYTKEHPTAIVNLLPQQIMGKAKGYFPDKEVMTAHAFPPSYIFHMIVHLTLPESQYNQEIGMFQVYIVFVFTNVYSNKLVLLYVLKNCHMNNIDL